MMEDYCAFSMDHKCILYMDYQFTKLELEEAESLCQGSWVEIQRLTHYVDQLKEALRQAGVNITEYDFCDSDGPCVCEDADKDC